MRILMVIRTGYRKNPYVISLVDGLIKYGHQVTCGLDKFWDSFAEYDLLYFQWPEAIFDWGRGQIDLERLSRHFDSIKRAGVKTVITCHNLHSHMNDGRMKGLYDLVYSNMDAFHHLGRYSYDVMKEKYPDTIHFMAPHHIADCLWENPVDPFVAKRKLHIPKANVVVSSFGAFRNDEEIRLYVDMAKDITSFHMTFLAPRIPMGHFYHGRHVGKTIQYLFKAFLYKIIRSQLKNRFEIKRQYATSFFTAISEDQTFSAADEQFVLKLNRFIRENLSNTMLGVDMIVDHMNVSRTTLFNKMNNLVGVSTNKYIRRIRIDAAKEMLSKTNKSVGTIAEETGFSESQYFSTVFKQETGMTPSQFKDSLRRI